ncbi:MAG: DUF2279 domain-containing protein [Bacteroidota bacterium]|nr:DUF2279 domain-containing protein [Bacteroidota bacterium]
MILFLSFSTQFYAQEIETKTLNKKRKNILLISEGVAYSATLVGLNSLWYKDYPRSNFHFINDDGEWLQMDKMGHMTSSYYMGVAGIKAYRWAGMNEKQAIWYGGLSGSFFLTAVEVLDGFSDQWGASSGDLLANTLGSALCISQALYWNEQKIKLKYSYTKSFWVDKNPAQLGENLLQNMLKDYNGQKYWVSFNIKAILKLENDFPSWLSFSFGYSGYGMINPYHEKDDPERIREYFLALDVDLNKIQTKSKIVNSVLHTFGFVKFPMPTLGYRKGEVFLHPLFF